MTDDIDKKANMDEAEPTEDMDKKAGPSDADLAKVAAAADAKQARYRLDEYLAITIGVGATLILWFLQWLGLY